VNVYDRLQGCPPFTVLAFQSGTLIESNVFKVQMLIVIPRAGGASNCQTCPLHDSPTQSALGRTHNHWIREPFEFRGFFPSLAQNFSIGAIKCPAKLPISRWKPLCGDVTERKPALSIHPLPRPTPSQSPRFSHRAAFVQRRQCGTFWRRVLPPTQLFFFVFPENRNTPSATRVASACFREAPFSPLVYSSQSLTTPPSRKGRA